MLYEVITSLLKYAFIISVLLAVFESFDRKAHLITQEQKDSSLFYKPLVSIAPFVFPYLNFNVITSYSIHYTKLYEHFCKLVTS